MKRGVLVLWLMVYVPAFTLLCAQNMDKFYKQSVSSEGQVYFVLPQKMAVDKSMGESEGVSPLSIDYTYVQAKDSVTLLFTLRMNEAEKADSLKFVVDNASGGSFPIRMLYSEYRKNRWHFRYKSLVPYSVWKSVYSRSQPFSLVLVSTEAQRQFAFRYKKWGKEHVLFVRLFQLMEMNRPE